MKLFLGPNVCSFIGFGGPLDVAMVRLRQRTGRRSSFTCIQQWQVIGRVREGSVLGD